jgi:hypothetical protein
MVMPKRGLDFERLVLTGFRALVLRRTSGTVRDETEGSNPVSSSSEAATNRA